MSHQILDRSLTLAMQAALAESYESFDAAIGRLRTLDRHDEIPVKRYLAMEGIAHARAGHLPEAKHALSRLMGLDESMASEVKRLLFSTAEARNESFRRFVQEAIPEGGQTGANGAGSQSKRLRWVVAIAGAGAIIIIAGIVWIALTQSRIGPVELTAERAAPVEASVTGDTAAARQITVPPTDSEAGVLYSRMKQVVCKVILRVEVLLDDGKTVKVPAKNGTGFVVSRDGLILTNGHVVGGGREIVQQYQEVVSWDIVVVFGDQEPLILEGGIVQQSTAVDLAWIRMDRGFDQALEFGRTPAPGQRVMAYGFPAVASRLADELNLGELKQRASKIETAMEDGDELDLMEWLGPNSMTLIVTSGVISAWHDTEEGLMLQTDAFVHDGNSGGPVLDEAGCVVGIATLRSSVVESANMCLSGRTIHEELAREQGIVWPDQW
jgi:S1-C subfamily serine protease